LITSDGRSAKSARGARRVHLADAAVDHLDALGRARLVKLVVDRGENEDFVGHATYRSNENIDHFTLLLSVTGLSPSSQQVPARQLSRPAIFS
jgi:hypothetical protein